MDSARRFVGRVFHSDDRKTRRDQQPPDIQQPRGEHGEQPNNQQSQMPGRSAGKGSVRSTLRSLSPFIKKPRSGPEATAPSHARPPSQADTVGGGTMAPTSRRIDIVTSSKSLIPPGQDPVLSSGESQHSPGTPTHPPPGLGGDDTVPHIHCSPPPLETASAGNPGVSATVIPASNLPDIATTTIAPGNPSSQTPGPVSIPASDPQLSTVPQTNNSPSTAPPSITPHLWQKAVELAQESLTKYKLPSLELSSLQSQSAAENIQSLVAELEIAHKENKDRQWRYKDRQGNEVVLVERLGEILKNVDKYAKIVDTAIQNHPDITSLVWAGARTILQVCHIICNGLPEGSSPLLSSRLRSIMLKRWNVLKE